MGYYFVMEQLPKENQSIEAAQAGKRISSVDVDYAYDPSQSGSEENDRSMKEKRVIQYKKILGELGDEFWKKK